MKTTDNFPWCEPCKSYHMTPRDAAHRKVLKCRAPDPVVTTSLRHLKVGDAITVHEPHSSRIPWPTRVNRVGRKYLYVEAIQYRHHAFDLDTGVAKEWSQYEVRTPAREAWLDRVVAARHALRRFGVTFDHHITEVTLMEIREALINIIPLSEEETNAD